MDNNQLLLVKLLSKAIRGECTHEIEEFINWREVLEEAKYHDVQSLLYPLINKIDIGKSLDNETMLSWRKSTLLSGMVQFQHIEEMGRVLSTFNRANIPVMVLKGLVLRELYPSPELRNMGDADILVRKRDMETAKKLILELGYSEESLDSKHISFIHAAHLPIELHHSITSQGNTDEIRNLEESLWEDAISIKVNNTSALALSYENQVLHLCLHMADHFRYSGFGIRQLCDLFLFIECYIDMIDWNSFHKKIKMCGIEKFTIALFTACTRLFEMKVPDMIFEKVLGEDSCIDLFIEDILAGGVFGKKTMERLSGSLHLHYSKDNGDSLPGKLSALLAFLFPHASKLEEKYAYARNNPLLTPIAWIQRFIYGAFTKEYTLAEKKTVLFSGASAPGVQERAKLLKQLGLI